MAVRSRNAPRRAAPPRSNPLPRFHTALEYDDASLEACHDPAVIAEARDVAAAHARAAERPAPRLAGADADADDLRAAGALHSRCFTHGPRGTHLAVPGVDITTARRTRRRRSAPSRPRTRQGTAAAAEVADVDAAEKAVEERYFQLPKARRAWRRAKRCASATDPGRTIRSFCISGSCSRETRTTRRRCSRMAMTRGVRGEARARDAAAKARARAARDAAAAVAANGARDE